MGGGHVRLGQLQWHSHRVLNGLEVVEVISFALQRTKSIEKKMPDFQNFVGFRIPLVSYCVKKVGFPLTKVSLSWVDGRIDIEICSPSLAAVAALRLDHGTPLRLHPLVLQKRILEVTWPLFCTGDRNSALMSLVVSKGGGHGETKWCLV